MNTKRYANYFALTTVYGLASVVALFMFMVRPGMTGHPEADFHQLVYGSAHKPYVYRVAVPAIVRAVSEVTPMPLRNAVSDQLRGREVIDSFGWYEPYLYEFAVAALLIFACFVGFAFCLRALNNVFYRFPPAVSNLSPVIGLLLLPLFFRYYSYPYDPGVLFSFALALVFLVQERFRLFVVAFTLATLNKETSILLIALYACWNWLQYKRVRPTRILLLAAIWAVVKVGLAILFLESPGGHVERHFREHNIWLLTTFPMAMRYTLCVALLYFVFIRQNWRGKPRFLRMGLVIVLGPLMVASLFFGFTDELRVYYEALPFLYLLSIPSILKNLGLGLESDAA